MTCWVYVSDEEADKILRNRIYGEAMRIKQDKFNLWNKVANVVDKMTGGVDKESVEKDKETLKWLSAVELW